MKHEVALLSGWSAFLRSHSDDAKSDAPFQQGRFLLPDLGLGQSELCLATALAGVRLLSFTHYLGSGNPREGSARSSRLGFLPRKTRGSLSFPFIFTSVMREAVRLYPSRVAGSPVLRDWFLQPRSYVFLGVGLFF